MELEERKRGLWVYRRWRGNGGADAMLRERLGWQSERNNANGYGSMACMPHTYAFQKDESTQIPNLVSPLP